jgi:hypothetical protein
MVVKGSTQQISALWRINLDLCILVRPDRYVFGAFRMEEENDVAKKMQGMLQGQ